MPYTTCNTFSICDPAKILTDLKTAIKNEEVPLCSIFSCESIFSENPVFKEKQKRYGKFAFSPFPQGKKYDSGKWKIRNKYTRRWEKRSIDDRQWGNINIPIKESERRITYGEKRYKRQANDRKNLGSILSDGEQQGRMSDSERQKSRQSIKSNRESTLSKRKDISASELKEKTPMASENVAVLKTKKVNTDNDSYWEKKRINARKLKRVKPNDASHESGTPSDVSRLTISRSIASQQSGLNTYESQESRKEAENKAWNWGEKMVNDKKEPSKTIESLNETNRRSTSATYNWQRLKRMTIEPEKARILEWKRRNTETGLLDKRVISDSRWSHEHYDSGSIRPSVKRGSLRLSSFEKKRRSKIVKDGMAQHLRINEVRAAIFKMLKMITNPRQSDNKSVPSHFKGLPIPRSFERKSENSLKRYNLGSNQVDEPVDTKLNRKLLNSSESKMKFLRRKEMPIPLDLSPLIAKNRKKMMHEEPNQKKARPLVNSFKDSKDGSFLKTRSGTVYKKLADPYTRIEYIKKIGLVSTKPLFQQQNSKKEKLPSLTQATKIERKHSKVPRSPRSVNLSMKSNISEDLDIFRKLFLKSKDGIASIEHTTPKKEAVFPQMLQMKIRNKFLAPYESYKPSITKRSRIRNFVEAEPQLTISESVSSITLQVQKEHRKPSEDRTKIDGFGQPLVVQRSTRAEMAMFAREFPDKLAFVPPISYMDILRLSPDEFNTFFKNIRNEVKPLEFQKFYAALRLNPNLTLKYRTERLKNYLNDDAAKVSDMDDISIDDIDLSDFLHFPYGDKYHEPATQTTASLKLPKRKRYPRKVKEKKKQTREYEELEPSIPPSCCICDSIHHKKAIKDNPPFIIKMKDQIKRDELKAYLRKSTGLDKINTHFTPNKPSILVQYANTSPKYQSSPTNVFYRSAF